MCFGPTRESVYDTGFTWDLVDDLDSRKSFQMIYDPLKDVFNAFDPLGMLLMLSIH